MTREKGVVRVLTGDSRSEGRASTVEEEEGEAMSHIAQKGEVELADHLELWVITWTVLQLWLTVQGHMCERCTQTRKMETLVVIHSRENREALRKGNATLKLLCGSAVNNNYIIM